jgi:hypothetical protein
MPVLGHKLPVPFAVPSKGMDGESARAMTVTSWCQYVSISVGWHYTTKASEPLPD